MSDNDSSGDAAEPAFEKEGIGNVLTVAISVCLVCSIVVSTAAVMLKPMQEANRELDQKQNILRAAGVLPADSNVAADGRGVDELFADFTVRAVNLDTGEYVDDVDPTSYDPIRAAKEPARSRDLSSEQDIATLGRRENVSLVYLKQSGDELESVVIPVRGYGLWGTLFGYLALDGDLKTVQGLGFYSHKETPGLGGEVDNAAWKAQWPGVHVYGENFDPRVRLVKSRAPAGSPEARYQVDALSGATLTSRGVENLINFWTGELGFGPYLERLRAAS